MTETQKRRDIDTVRESERPRDKETERHRDREIASRRNRQKNRETDR